MSFPEFTVRSFAKINWLLHVLRKRRDGFHDIETVFQTISLHDDLAFAPAAQFALTCSDPRIPIDESNLIASAWRELSSRREIPPVAIHIEKRIPAGGGLGGGSSNAAMTLMALDRVFSLDLESEVLHAMAAALGADVPFFLRGGTMFATGRGEDLETLPDVTGVSLLLVLPEETMKTAEAYAALGRLEEPSTNAEGWDSWSARIVSGLAMNAGSLSNDFEGPFFARYPNLEPLKSRLLDLGAAKAMLSGSGSSIFGVFDRPDARDRAASALASSVRVVAADPIPERVVRAEIEAIPRSG